MTLDEIAIKYGTDKATVHPLIKGHGYTPTYSRFFEPIRWREIKLLEIGVGGGESIQTWLDYFPKARVFGVDNNQGTNTFNTVGKFHDRYTFIHGDQSDDVLWKCLVADHGSDWDVVIDDGSHYADHIATAFNGMWPHIRPAGGLYCVEDLAVVYGGAPFCPTAHPDHLEWLKSLMHQINRGENAIHSLNFTRELAILTKE